MHTGKGNAMEHANTRGGATEGSGVMARVRETASAQLASQKDRATDGLGSVVQAVRQSTQQLRDQQHDTLAQYVEQAANHLERFSQGLKNKDINELLTDAQQMARRQPALFIGSAFAIGLLGARFIKSSSPGSDYQGMQYGSDSRWQTEAYPASGHGGPATGTSDPRYGSSANPTERF